MNILLSPTYWWEIGIEKKEDKWPFTDKEVADDMILSFGKEKSLAMMDEALSMVFNKIDATERYQAIREIILKSD